MVYFGTRLSGNISRRDPEGYLICLNVPVARTGIQEYLPEELGLTRGDGLIPVYRPEEEVFAPACMASFEGMPVTDDHPAFTEGVNAENIRYLQKGHAHNIRRGEGDESDLLLADLIITDPGLIGEIMAGKREISCGYNYMLCREDGQYVQREIRGNHVAVVEAGRAGPRVSIRDHEKEGRSFPAGRKNGKNERRKQMKQNRGTYGNNGAGKARGGMAAALRTARGTLSAGRVARLMAMMARDGETEELAEMIAEIVEPEEGLRADAPAEQLQAESVGGIAEAVEEIIGGDEEEVATVAEAVTPAAVGAVPVAMPAAMAQAVPVAAPVAAPASVAQAVPVASPVPAPMAVAQAMPGAAAPDAPVAMAIPENHRVTIDGGEELLSLLRQIVALLTPAADSGEKPTCEGGDCGGTPTRDEEPQDGAVEAVVEAVTRAVEAATGETTVPDEDPMEALVAEVVKSAVEGEDPTRSLDPEEDPAGGIGVAITSALADPLTGEEQKPLGASEDEGVLSGVTGGEEEEGKMPSARTADALRAAMATFRPILKSMAPEARRQAVAKIAANIRAQDHRRGAVRSASGTADTYALLKGAARRGAVADPTGLGKKIMASRNPNYKG